MPDSFYGIQWKKRQGFAGGFDFQGSTTSSCFRLKNAPPPAMVQQDEGANIGHHVHFSICFKEDNVILDGSDLISKENTLQEFPFFAMKTFSFILVHIPVRVSLVPATGKPCSRVTF